jgi:hypothetical protein
VLNPPLHLCNDVPGIALEPMPIEGLGQAARALAEADQQQVADSAGVNVNTIRNMEARGAKPITSSAVTVRRVQLALEALGIEFLNHAQLGVRLRKRQRANR